MLELARCLLRLGRRQNGTDYGDAAGPCVDDVGGVCGVDAADAEAGDGQRRGQFLQELNTLGSLVRMGAGGEDGASYQIVGTLLLGIESAPGIVNGAADDDLSV